MVEIIETFSTKRSKLIKDVSIAISQSGFKLYQEDILSDWYICTEDFEPAWLFKRQKGERVSSVDFRIDPRRVYISEYSDELVKLAEIIENAGICVKIFK